MKNITYLLILTASVYFGCNSNDEKTDLFIQNFFDSNTQFTCSDSVRSNVQLKFLHYHLNMEKMSFEFVIPDSIKFSDFYNAYTGRIADAYYKSRKADKNKSIDSLFFTPNCDVEKVKNNIIRYYCDDEVFFEIFRTALSSFYESNSGMQEYEGINKMEKVDFTIDSLIQLALMQFDIVNYDPDRGFAYHFVCGVNPYSYSIENKANFLIIGFCQEALRNKEMYEAHSTIMKHLREKVKQDNEYEASMIDELCNKYQNELYKLLLEEGTLRNSLFAYYEKRKDIEPFKIVN